MTGSPEVFCTAPWVGLTIREDGNVRTCCIGKTSLGNLNQTNIDEILVSQPLKQIQQRMLTGQPDLENCQGCIHSQQQSGLATLRQHYNLFYTEFVPDQFDLQFLDVRWNNTCNLGCMYCNANFSSVWQDRLNIKRDSVVKDYQTDLLDWILNNSHRIKEVMLVGGEPMLMKQNYKLLNQLPDHSEISVITNLSYKLHELPTINKLLSKPRQTVKWNVSLENTGMQFEYVRNGSDWAQVEHNLRYLTEHWSETVSINFVYSIFSAFDILETVKTLHQLGIKKINFFPIDDVPCMDVFNMPEIIRKKAADEFELAKQWHFENLHPEDREFYPLQGADAILNHLSKSSKGSPITLDMFQNQIDFYDQYNSKKFRDLWPNVIDLVEKYL